MAMIKDKRTGFDVLDPEKLLFKAPLPSYEEIQEALKPMILSASGWRKVFASDGDEESTLPYLSAADTFLCAAMAEIFTAYLSEVTRKDTPLVLLGMDARYTGPAMADAMLRIMLARKVQVRFLYISAAPELMAYAGQCSDVDGFIYISASHNPIGHNGVKFGLNNGGVLEGSQASHLIKLYRDYLSDPLNIPALTRLCDSVSSESLIPCLNDISRWKSEAEGVYRAFTSHVISGEEDKEKQNSLKNRLNQGIASSPLGVVAELNGSARTLSIDNDYLSSLGIAVVTVNGIPRQISHRIVPEGESLNLCRDTLEKEHKKDPSFQLGYVPDNDGDRGNLVYLNSRTGKAEILEAQEVFALSVLAELAYLDWSGLLDSQTAVAVNGPTSGRIDEIARCFDSSVFRAEVGEANVVNLAREKRASGWQVRILGEGSNGGNITYPAAVRDPLNTLGALLKLLTLRTEGDKPGLYHIWCIRSGQPEKYSEDFTLTHILESLPAYTTTSAYEPRALMQICTTDHALLKRRYEEVFAREWALKRDELKKRFGISCWQEWNQEGTGSRQGVGASFRSGAEKGGLTIRFMDSQDCCIGYIWMRGSGTEPVFRVMADWKGKDASVEAYFLEWHKSMIRMADES